MIVSFRACERPPDACVPAGIPNRRRIVDFGGPYMRIYEVLRGPGEHQDPVGCRYRRKGLGMTPAKNPAIGGVCVESFDAPVPGLRARTLMVELSPASEVECRGWGGQNPEAAPRHSAFNVRRRRAFCP